MSRTRPATSSGDQSQAPRNSQDETWVLLGYRGAAPADRDVIAYVLLRVSRMLDEHPELVELDINPPIVLEAGRGATAVDARIRIANQTGGAVPSSAKSAPATPNTRIKPN